MATSLLSMQRSEVRQPGRVSQPSAHNCIYEKAELRAASLSPKSHAAHRQGEELMGSSWSSSQHSSGQGINPVRFVAGQERQLLLAWQKAGARDLHSQRETGVLSLQRWSHRAWNLTWRWCTMRAAGTGMLLSGEGPCSWALPARARCCCCSTWQHPWQQQQPRALALPSTSSSSSYSHY